MSDQITRYQINNDNSKVVKYQVQDNVNNDKLVRYQVEGLSGSPAPAPVLDSLTVTANGTYTPAEGIDGFNEVIVDVASEIPSEVIISEFDFLENYTENKPYYYDKKRLIEMPGNFYSNLNQVNSGAYITATNGKLNTGNYFNYGDMFMIEIEFGEFDKTTEPTNTNNILINLNNKSGTSYAMLDYQPNSGSPRWYIHDRSGNNVYLDEGIADPYKFENKKIICIYGGILRDGKIYRYVSSDGSIVNWASRWTFYWEDGTPIVEDYKITCGADSNDYLPRVVLGSYSNSFIGACFKKCTVKMITDRYNSTYEEV